MDDVLEGELRGGIELVRDLRKKNPRLPIVVVVEESKVGNALRLFQAGATDFLIRGDNLPALLVTQMKKIDKLIELIEQNHRLAQRNKYLQDMESARFRMIGDSPQIQRITEQIKRVAVIPRPVLITGERGTGKELVARAIHEESRGKAGYPLVTLNCAAFSDTLLESELFGHERGAFTGADKQRQGKFEEARNGTLFLDEIGNMSKSFQQKIMRVVEYGTFRRIGGGEVRVTTRVIAATNADLKERIKDGSFLSDLYDRLAFEVINLPPLREREGEIEKLAIHFLYKFMEEIPSFQGKRFSTAAMAVLRRYAYPGNIRELKNIVERSVYRDTTNHITPADLGLEISPEEIVEGIEGTTFKEKTESFECHLIRQALENSRFNQAEAARRLGLSYHQLRYFLKKYQDRCNPA